MWEQLHNTLPLWSCIPERARYVDMHLCLLCTFLPSVALRMTNRHTISFICCLKCISKSIYEYVDPVTKWIRGYVVTEYPHIHLCSEVALRWQGILQLSQLMLITYTGHCRKIEKPMFWVLSKRATAKNISFFLCIMCTFDFLVPTLRD